MERLKLSKIKANGKNPRLIKDENFDKLVKSLLVFPRMLELRPIVIDNENVVLGGNMRLRALKRIAKLSTEEITKIVKTDQRLHDEEIAAIVDYWNTWKRAKDAPVVKADDLTEEQKREFIIKDNSGFGEWDFNALGNEWDDLPLTEWSVPAWNTEAVNTYMGDEQGEERVTPDKDYSDDIEEEYKMEIECKDEMQLQTIFNELTERGILCRILTL